MRTQQAAADEPGLITNARVGVDGIAALYERFEEPVLRYFAVFGGRDPSTCESRALRTANPIGR